MHPQHGTLPVQKAFSCLRKYKDRQLPLSMATILRDPGCVTRMVSDLGRETLESRMKKDRLTTLYKIRHGLVDMDTGDVLRLNDRRTRGQKRLYQPTANVKVYKDSFFPRTIQDWNRLPAVVTDSPTIEEFRASLEQQVPTLRC